MKRIILITLALLGSLLYSHAQAYATFDGEPATVYPGMRYRQYKKLYNPRFYIPDANDQYQPGLAGLASFLFPGLGQISSGELGRGFCILAADVALSTSTVLSLFYGESMINEQTGEYEGGYDAPLIFYGSLIGKAVLDIWNVFDAAHVAKVKNMYYQDLRAQRAAYDIKVEPFFATTPSIPTSSPQHFAGLSFKVSF